MWVGGGRQVDLGRATSRGEPPAGVNMRFVGDHFCTGIKVRLDPTQPSLLCGCELTRTRVAHTQLGKGMFGTVFLGYHVKSARRVAIKVVTTTTAVSC
jgi:hypothetical protein